MAEYGENKIYKANGELCRIKDLSVGDYIFDAFGYPTEIIGILKKRAILWKMHLITKTDIYTDDKQEPVHQLNATKCTFWHSCGRFPEPSM